jgi:hypothetical protein
LNIGAQGTETRLNIGAQGKEDRLNIGAQGDQDVRKIKTQGGEDRNTLDWQQQLGQRDRMQQSKIARRMAGMF